MIDDTDEARLRTRIGVKWSRYPADVLPAWVADMDFPTAPPIAVALHAMVERGDMGYPPDAALSGLAARFVERAQTRWGWDVDPALVTVLPDVVGGIEHAITALTTQGDAVLVTTPIYPPFTRVVAACGRRLVDAPLLESGALDLAAIERVVVGERVRIVLLCNPHNPTGHVPTADELGGLATIAARHGVVVVSDEIHADLVYAGATHVPFASLGPHASDQAITLNSASKAFNIAGLRCAVSVAGSPSLHHRVVGSDPPHEPVGMAGIVASLAAWSPDGDSWLADCLAMLDGNRRTVETWAAALGLGYRTPEATYLAWLDFRPLGINTAASRVILERARVALSPGADFGAAFGGFARLNFATTPALLAEILDRIGTALNA